MYVSLSDFQDAGIENFSVSGLSFILPYVVLIAEVYSCGVNSPESIETLTFSSFKLLSGIQTFREGISLILAFVGIPSDVWKTKPMISTITNTVPIVLAVFSFYTFDVYYSPNQKYKIQLIS